ncbi:MAG: dihydropteroate synthase, partial [Pirellulales bacterium]
IIPGYCHGDLTPVAKAAGLPIERGPKDLRQLPDYFGNRQSDPDYGDHDIEIVAEINHCPRLALEEIVTEADRLASCGADVIDVGCDPGSTWSEVGDVIRALRDSGHRVSIDSFNACEVELAVRAGAELVLSVNGTNLEPACDWGVEVVVVPDPVGGMPGLDGSIERLRRASVPFRIDPVLEPIGLGFAASLARYQEIRRRYPECEMLMGIGNLTELTDVDSAGVNVLLLGFCQELGIRSVLTTEVINWARSSLRECVLARELVYYAVDHRLPPKHLQPELVVLRDPALRPMGEAERGRLAALIKDSHVRLLAEEGELHLLTSGRQWSDRDPFRLFASLLASGPQDGPPRNLDLSHAFYLGYEMCKATTALTLGKQYVQDESLNWGFLTEPERSHRGANDE